MQIGVHGFTFSGAFDPAGTRAAIEGAQRSGFDFLEMPLVDPFSFDEGEAKRVLDDTGISMTASLGLSAENDISSTDPATVRAGRDRLRRAVDIVHALGGTHFCGVIYSAMQKYMEPATPEGRENSARVLHELSAYAADAGVTLAIEIVNRYETNVCNTVREGRAFLDLIGHPNMRLHLDTYHMNIEESGLWEPTLEAGDRLGYVHVGESHRGYLGSGTIDFGAFYRALVRLGYDGPIVFESFSSAIVDEQLTRQLGIWRNLWNDSHDLATHACRSIRDGLHAARSIALQ